MGCYCLFSLFFGFCFAQYDVDEDGFPTFPPQSNQRHEQISARIRYSKETSAVWFCPADNPEWGHNPSVSEEEAELICKLPEVKFLAFYYCPIANRELSQILAKQRPTHLVFRHGRDETCALLAKYDQIENIEILGGDVTVSGLILLKRIRQLKSLFVCTQFANGISKQSLSMFPTSMNVKIRCYTLTEAGVAD